MAVICRIIRRKHYFAFPLLDHLNTKVKEHCLCSCQRRHLSTEAPQDKKRFITTPIFYVNAAPHIGHLYSALLADVWARWHSIQGYDVMYSTGTDEHGIKIQQAAEKAGMEPVHYCDKLSQTFKDLFIKADVSHTHFVRTTDPSHRQAVEEFWRTLQKGGNIYQGSYEGWYSVSDEMYVGKDDVKIITNPKGETSRVSAVTGNVLEWTKEENYLFRLSEFKPQLTQWLDKGVIKPSGYEHEVRKLLENLQDLSISRPASRMPWGIPVPEDNEQTIYVWLDALVNYLGVTGYPGDRQYWPADVHVVGKDILMFHAVYWPAFLIAAGLELPKQILCHGHWLCDGHKMSKSRGNVIDPMNRIEKYTSDGLRFMLLRDGNPSGDCNYTDEVAVDIINGELINNFVNLMSRSSGQKVNPKQILPCMNEDIFRSKFTEDDHQMMKSLYTLADEVNVDYLEFRVYAAVRKIFNHVRWANKLMTDHKPWELVKTPGKEEHLNTVLHIAMETSRVCAILLHPITPSLCGRVFDRLGIDMAKRTVEFARCPVEDRDKNLGKTSSTFFKRINKD